MNMEDKSNFSKRQWGQGHKIEALINMFYDDFLIWNNSPNSKPTGQYDGNINKPDFYVKETDLSIEVQMFNFEKSEIIIPKRRLYNYVKEDDRVIYKEMKDISRTIL